MFTLQLPAKQLQLQVNHLRVRVIAKEAITISALRHFGYKAMSEALCCKTIHAWQVIAGGSAFGAACVAAASHHYMLAVGGVSTPPVRRFPARRTQPSSP